MKIVTVNYIVVSTALAFVSSVCWAYHQEVPKKIECSSSIGTAGWYITRPHIDPGARYTLTTVGMEIPDKSKGANGIVALWADDDEEHDYENHYDYGLTYGRAHVIAVCIPRRAYTGTEEDVAFLQQQARAGLDTKMYDYPKGSQPPMLACQKGEGIGIKFLSPNNPNPRQFIYHANLAIDRDDPHVCIEDVQPQRIRIDLPQRGIVPPGIGMMGMGMGGGSTSY